MGASRIRSSGRRPRPRRRWGSSIVKVGLVYLLVLLGASSRAAAAGLKPDEQVIFYPALARPVKDGWEIETHGLVYEPERRRLATGLLRRLFGRDEEDLAPG